MSAPPISEPLASTQKLGERIRRTRKALGLTQAQAAGLCGVGVRFLSELERGKPSCELGLVMQVIARLGLVLRLENRS